MFVMTETAGFVGAWKYNQLIVNFLLYFLGQTVTSSVFVLNFSYDTGPETYPIKNPSTLAVAHRKPKFRPFSFLQRLLFQHNE